MLSLDYLLTNEQRFRRNMSRARLVMLLLSFIHMYYQVVTFLYELGKRFIFLLIFIGINLIILSWNLVFYYRFMVYMEVEVDVLSLSDCVVLFVILSPSLEILLKVTRFSSCNMFIDNFTADGLAKLGLTSDINF